jgi:hypothetical protein
MIGEAIEERGRQLGDGSIDRRAEAIRASPPNSSAPKASVSIVETIDPDTGEIAALKLRENFCRRRAEEPDRAPLHVGVSSRY